jgi:hypothetical protein
MITGSGTVAFNLPVGYRPDAQILVGTVVNDTTGWIRIAANGDVSTSGSWATLDGIMFPAAGVANWTPITQWFSGFGPYSAIDPTFPPAGYWQDPLGRVWMRGLITRVAAIVTDTEAFHVPGLPPPAVLHLSGISSGGHAAYHLSGVGDAALFVKAGNPAWMSIDRCGYVPSTTRTLADATKLRMSLSNWTNFGGGYPVASMNTFSDGIAMMMGLIAPGTYGASAMACWTPEGMSPDNSIGPLMPGSQMFLTSSTNQTGRVDISRFQTNPNAGGSTVIPHIGVAGFVSLSGINYVIGS